MKAIVVYLQTVTISLLLALSIPSGLAASLNNGLLEKYLCSSRADGFKMLVPGSCTQYYECEGGETQVNTCLKYYDSVNEKCVDKNTGCVETIIEPLTCEGPCCGISDGGYAMNPTNHAIYYLCRNNCVAEKKCCENGQMFDLVKLKCDSPKECKECSTPKPPCTTTKPPCSTTTCPTMKASGTTTTCSNTKAPITITTCTTTKTPSTTCTTTTCIPTTTCTTTTCTTTSASTTTICTEATTTCTTTTCTMPISTTTCTTTTCTTTTTTCTTTICRTTTTSCTTITCTTTTTFCTTTTCTRTNTTCTTTTATGTVTTTACTSTTPACTSTKLKPTAKVTRKTVTPTKAADHSTLQKKIDHYSRNACTDKPNGYLMASLTSCNEYYICTHHRALRVSCDKKYFNAYLGICDLPENTNCVQYQYRSK